MRILVPMLTFSQEMSFIRDVFNDLSNHSKSRSKIPLGAMIETPAAAMCIEDFIPFVDFFSIGTNDLTQYTMAAGRENNSVTQYFMEDHPAIFKIIKIIMDNVGTTVPVSVCGELAGNSSVLTKMFDLGITQLSVAPALIPELKNVIRSS